jgi:hypothetical protein
MREVPTFSIAVAAMLVAFAWSLLQEPVNLQEASLPMPTVASTMEPGPVSN